jgi:hypothetical protein
MSIQIVLTGTPTEPTPVDLTTTNETDIFAPTQKGEFFAGFSAVNKDSSNARDLTVYFNDGSTSYEIHKETVAAKSTVRVTDLPFLAVSSGAKFTAQASVANDIVITPIVIFAPNG